MFKHRSREAELLDDFSLKGDELKKNLDEMESINHYFGSKKVLLTALDQLSLQYPKAFRSKLKLIDLGCGSGDLIRAISDWVQKKSFNFLLIGIDANPFIIDYAKQKSIDYPSIHYEVIDIFDDSFKKIKFDIMCINSLTHHFDDETLVALFKQLKKQTNVAIIINDLQRHWFSYFAIKWLSRLGGFSYLAQKDGPLSILRAFKENELINLLSQAGITHYEIKKAFAFRWQIIIYS